MKLLLLVVFLLLLVFVDAGANSNPCAVDAAVTYENDLIYFFKGDQYGVYTEDGKIGYLNRISLWKGVPNNIDAVVKYKDNYYFFKGCYYYVWDTEARKVVHKKRSIKTGWKAPCNIDAAFTKDDYVYLLKGNKYWYWKIIRNVWGKRTSSKFMGGEKDIKNKFGFSGPFDAVVRWDENDMYYFFQGENYRRLNEDGDLGKKGSIASWKGLVDSGKELLKKCPCSCSRAGHNDNWKFISMEYDFDKAVVEKKELRDGIKIMRVNMQDHPQNCTRTCPWVRETIETTNTKKESFTSTTTLGLTIGVSFSVGIPAIAKKGIKTELSLTQAFTFGKEKVHSKSISSTYTCRGYPGKLVKCTVSEYMTKMEIPYTMTLKHKTKGCVCPSKGIFHQTDLGLLKMETKWVD